MPEWAYILALIAGYFFLTQWLLPKLGVPT